MKIIQHGILLESLLEEAFPKILSIAFPLRDIRFSLSLTTSPVEGIIEGARKLIRTYNLIKKKNHQLLYFEKFPLNKKLTGKLIWDNWVWE